MEKTGEDEEQIVLHLCLIVKFKVGSGYLSCSAEKGLPGQCQGLVIIGEELGTIWGMK